MAGSFSVTLSAVDHASATLMAVNKRIAGLTAPIARFQQASSKFAEVSGINKLSSGFKSLASGIGGAVEKAAAFAPAIGAIGSVASVAGIAAMVNSFAGFGRQLGLDAQRIGIAANQLHALQGAASLAGVSAETLTGGMRNLADTLKDAAAGRNTGAVVMLNTLGLSFRDAAGHARAAADMMPEIADKIASLKDPFNQARVATELFGGAGEAMLPFLRRGSAGIAELTEKSRSYGVINENAVAASLAFQYAQSSLGLAVTGLGNSISEHVLPVITPLIQRMADWIGANREWIATGIGDKVQQFGAWLSAIDWAAVGQRASDVAHSIQSVVTGLGGWQRVAEGLLAFMVGKWAIGIASAVSSSIAALAPLAAYLLPLAAAVGAIGFLGSHKNEGPGGGGGRMGPNAPAPNWTNKPAAPWNPLADDPHAGQTWTRGKGWQPSATKSSFTADSTITPEARGLLDTIADTESAGRYDVSYGGRQITDFSQHPGTLAAITSGPNAGQSSSAAGRYQFLKGTWQEAASALGLKDFSPESQDKAGWWLAQRDYNKKTGRDLADDVKSNDPTVRAGIGAALHGTWTSLPGGIEAGTNQDRFASALSRHIAQESAQRAKGAPVNLADRANGQTAGAPAPQQSDARRIQLDITHANAPRGTDLRVNASDGIDVSTPRVVRSLSPVTIGA